MTQPIQEPTTDRALQGMAYARDQIFRRPAPNVAPTIPYLRAITSSTIFVTPTEFTSGDLLDLSFGFWEISDATVFEANSFISGDLYIWEGLITGLYEVKMSAAFVFDSGNPESVSLQLLLEQVGGGSGGDMLLYNQIVGHDAQADIGNAYIGQWFVDVPPFDPEGTAIDPNDPPTGVLGYGQAEIITDNATSGGLKYARLEVYYHGPLGSATTFS